MVIDGSCGRKRRCSGSTAFLLVIALSAAAQQGAGPKITKVEPPNWWTGLPDPMVLFTGDNLEHASVSTPAAGIRVRRTQPGRNGHYLFVWLKISKSLPPEKCHSRSLLPTEKKHCDGSWSAEIPTAKV